MSDTEVEGTISTETACKLIMVSKVWLGKLVKDGYIEKVAHGKYDLVSVVQGHIRYLKDEERRTSKTSASTRMQDARTKQLERRMAVEAKELVNRDDARFVADFVAATTKNVMMQIPPRFTRNIAERDRLEAMIAEGLNEIADAVDEKATALETGGDVIG